MSTLMDLCVDDSANTQLSKRISWLITHAIQHGKQDLSGYQDYIEAIVRDVRTIEITKQPMTYAQVRDEFDRRNSIFNAKGESDEMPLDMHDFLLGVRFAESKFGITSTKEAT